MNYKMVIKGNLFGLSEQEVQTNNEILSFQFLNVLNSIEFAWKMKEHDKQPNPDVEQFADNYRGLVEEAFNAMYNDLHGLAALVDLMKLIYSQRNEQTRQKDVLYIQELTEKYMFNLRSIYDFMAKVLRLAVDPKKQGKIGLDSFNDLIANIEKGKIGDKLPEAAQKSILEGKPEFITVRDFRDKLVHNGKLVLILVRDDGYWIGNLFTENGQETSLPLFDFLRATTIEMMSLAEELAVVIYESYCNLYGSVPLYHTALDGVCIPSFVEFLGLANTPET